MKTTTRAATARPAWRMAPHLGLAPLLGLVLAAAPLAAFAAGDAANGLALARQWCVSCHVVARGDPRGPVTDAAPAFPSLRTRSEDELRAFLVSPHPPMPNFNLPREQIEDLIAHIRSIPAI